MGPVCQTLILLQLLCLYHAYHHPHCSCLLQTCREEGKGMLLLSYIREPTQCMISQICHPFECVILTSEFSSFLKVGGRFWCCLLPGLVSLLQHIQKLNLFPQKCGLLPPAGKARSFLSPVLLNLSIFLSYTASLHIWSQHWGIFSSDWRDPECSGRSLFFFQRGKIFETFPFCCLGRCRKESNMPFLFISIGC